MCYAKINVMVPHYTRNALFTAIGISLLLVAYVVDAQGYQMGHAVLFNLGIVTVSVALLDLLWRLAGGNPVHGHIAKLSTQIQRQIGDLCNQIERLTRTLDVIENAKTIGLEAVHDCAGNYGAKQEWFRIMEEAHASMDLMGRTLYEWIRAPDLEEIVIRKIENEGILFRWLLMDPENDHLSWLEEDGGTIGETLSKKIIPVCERLKAIRAKLGQDNKELLDVRVFRRFPLYCSVLRVDDRYFVTPYLQSVASRNSPLICIHGTRSPWAISYAREFEYIWNDSTKLFDDEEEGSN